jgi:hypothetical protein
LAIGVLHGNGELVSYAFALDLDVACCAAKAFFDLAAQIAARGRPLGDEFRQILCSAHSTRERSHSKTQKEKGGLRRPSETLLAPPMPYAGTIATILRSRGSTITILS